MKNKPIEKLRELVKALSKLPPGQQTGLMELFDSGGASHGATEAASAQAKAQGMSDMPTAVEVDALVDEIRPLLAGKNPALQGAVLADLLAIYICGHRHHDEKKAAKIREHFLLMHIEAVRQLIEVNAKILAEPER